MSPCPAAAMGAWCRRALGWGRGLRETFQRQVEDRGAGEAGTSCLEVKREESRLAASQAVRQYPGPEWTEVTAKLEAAWPPGPFPPRRSSPGWKNQAMAWALQNSSSAAGQPLASQKRAVVFCGCCRGRGCQRRASFYSRAGVLSRSPCCEILMDTSFCVSRVKLAYRVLH